MFRETVPQAMREAGVDPADVIGLGIDFTACTMMPTLADGTPLALLPDLRANPHAWVKLWKHHAAQPEADRINETAESTGQGWLTRYGGKISSEWFFSKALQILDEAPDVYARADRLIEAADWVVWRLTGVETRNPTTAGYKALWSKREGFPDPSYFEALDPRLADVVDAKMSRAIAQTGDRAGGLTPEAAAWTGLPAGTAVAVANVDAHVAVPAATVTEPGRMVMIMGTSTCHMVLGEEEHLVPGICGYVEDGIIPGYFGYEAGQSCVGDHFAWFTEHAVPERYQVEARTRGIDIHALLQEQAGLLAPGESGLLALDWWNGNRSVLVDAELGGLLVGSHPGHHRARDLPGPDRGDRVRDPRDHGGARGQRGPGQRGHRRRRPRRQEPADHADLRGRHRSRRSGSPRRTRRPPSGPRCSARWRRVPTPAATPRSRTPHARWPGSRTSPMSPIRRQPPSTTSCTASTSGSTTTSGAGRTT